MDTKKTSKINLLLQSQPQAVVFTSSWMSQNGFSLDLQRQYRKSNWFESIGSGAMVRKGDEVTVEGALYAIQQQLQLRVHIGARSALELQGKAHSLTMQKKYHLFGPLKEQLPKWFKDNSNWTERFEYNKTDFLPKAAGLVDIDFKGFKLKVSSTIRAILECLYFVPKKESIEECYNIMEGLNNLRPDQVQNLLEKCNSVKVKRLFLYMADKAGHPWLKYLNLNNIDLGKGKRSLVSNGVYNAKYQLVLPKEFEKNESGI